MVFFFFLLLSKIFFFFLCQFDIAEILYSLHINKYLITLINKDNDHNYIQDFIYSLPLLKKKYTIFSFKSKYVFLNYIKNFNLDYTKNYTYTFIFINTKKDTYYKRLDNTFFYYYKSTKYMNLFKTYGILLKKHQTIEKNITFKVIHRIAGVVLTQSLNKLIINCNISNL